ncbi:MAG: hypothetical protein JWM27_2332 [Gemmatimonadetes bacterium]|nr:hypothetical protein [Gemmatimonadota bacterium]
MARNGVERADREEPVSLPDAVKNLLDECRMVLPGIQALFGFQMVIVFNQGFTDKLTDPQRVVHLAAIGLVVLAIALVMAPAAIHRQLHPMAVSTHLLRLSTRLLLWSMVPLALGICADFFLVARVILGPTVVAPIVACALFAVFLVFWFVLPRAAALRHSVAGD